MSKKNKKSTKTRPQEFDSLQKDKATSVSDSNQRTKDYGLQNSLKAILLRLAFGLLILAIGFVLIFLIPACRSNRFIYFDRFSSGIPSISDREDVIRADIISQFNHITKDARTKIASMLGTTEEDVDTFNNPSDIIDSQNKQFIINEYRGLGLNTEYIFKEMRRLLKKSDILIDLQMGIKSDSLITKVSLLDFSDTHLRHEARISKHFTGSQDMERALDETIREVAAHAVFLTDPISAVLCDFQPGNGVDFYQTVNPWMGNAFDNRIELLQNAKENVRYANYRHLLLANIKASSGQQAMDREVINEAIDHYHLFLETNNEYQEQVGHKIQALERYLASPPIDLLNYVLKRQNPGKARQLIIVTSKGLDKTYMYCYQKNKAERWEVCKGKDSLHVHIGYNGLADENKKREGDGKTPSGYFPITRVFGVENDLHTSMPFDIITVNHVWVTDTADVNYNQLILDETGRYKNNKNEILLSENTHELNKYGIRIDYNMNPIIKGKGSAIYIHIERKKGELKKTAGCISLKEKDLIDIIEWLDPKQKPHIWIGKAPE